MAIDRLDLAYNVTTLLAAGTAVPGAAQEIKSSPFRHKRGIGKMSLWVKAAGGTPRLRVFVEGSTSDIDANYVPLTTVLDEPILTVADALPHAVNVPETWLPLIRVRVTDDTANGADTTIQVDLSENRVDD